MLGSLEHRRGTRERRIWIDEIGRRIDRAAVLTGVAVLILGAALRAFALDIAVGQEHGLDRIEELLDRLGIDQTRLFELEVDVLRERRVGRRVGAAPMVVGNVKAVEAFRASGGDFCHQLVRCDPFGLRPEHDRRAVGVVRADEMHRMPLHPLEAHPDIGLDVLHDMSDVKRTVGVGQRGGDEERAARHARKPLTRQGNCPF